MEGRDTALISGYVPKMLLISTVSCQRNLSVKMADLQAEIVMHEFPCKIVVFYIFAMMMATAVQVETFELCKIFGINTEYENLRKRTVTGRRWIILAMKFSGAFLF
jgi:hypothetical protein